MRRVLERTFTFEPLPAQACKLRNTGRSAGEHCKRIALRAVLAFARYDSSSRTRRVLLLPSAASDCRSAVDAKNESTRFLRGICCDHDSLPPVIVALAPDRALPLTFARFLFACCLAIILIMFRSLLANALLVSVNTFRGRNRLTHGLFAAEWCLAQRPRRRPPTRVERGSQHREK